MNFFYYYYLLLNLIKVDKGQGEGVVAKSEEKNPYIINIYFAIVDNGPERGVGLGKPVSPFCG